MGLFGPSKSERETQVAITVYLAEQTWERLSKHEKERVQDEVNAIVEGQGGLPLQVFTIPTHHRWWIYASAMNRLGIQPFVPGERWRLGKLDPSEFDEDSESFQLALQGAEHVYVDSPRIGPVKNVGSSVEIDATVVGRNEPCPCGSGLRYKRCHGRIG